MHCECGGPGDDPFHVGQKGLACGCPFLRSKLHVRRAVLVHCPIPFAATCTSYEEHPPPGRLNRCFPRQLFGDNWGCLAPLCLASRRRVSWQGVLGAETRRPTPTCVWEVVNAAPLDSLYGISIGLLFARLCGCRRVRSKVRRKHGAGCLGCMEGSC